jgi:hypothetical protein
VARPSKGRTNSTTVATSSLASPGGSAETVTSGRVSRLQCAPATEDLSKPQSKLAQRFWSMVDVKGEDECWPWTGYVMPSGYGRARVKGIGRVYAHRQAYEFASEDVGLIPDGMFCCHTCSNKLCCNPAHLFLATPAQSVENNFRRGLVKRGSELPFAKLTEAEVCEIRRRHAAEAKLGISQAKLAKEYGVSAGAIQRVLERKNWKDVA